MPGRIGGGEAAIRSGRPRPRLGNRTGGPGGSDKRASGPVNGAAVVVGACWLARWSRGQKFPGYIPLFPRTDLDHFVVPVGYLFFVLNF